MVYFYLKGGIMMKNNSSILKKLISLCLAAIMIMSLTAPVFAVKVEDELQKTQFVYMFNDAVNSIKEKKPSFRYEKTAKLNTEEGYAIGSKSAADLSDDAVKWVNWIVESLVTPDEGLFDGLVANLTDANSDYVDMNIAKGTDVKYLLPVSGKDYVSALTADDEYELSYIEENEKERLIYYFPDCPIEDKDTSALPKLYDLPTGTLNPVIFGGVQFDEDDDPLDKVKLADFQFFDAAVQADFNAGGELTTYIQKISYSFSMSVYDLVRAFEAYAGTGWNVFKFALDIANKVFENTGKDQMTAEEILKDSMIYLHYDVKIKLSQFDWLPRYFGDIDNSGDVESLDARLALRHGVGLENITAQEDLIYGDIDFSGAIDSADARLTLRTAVGLEKKFDTVPEGEEIKIVIIVPPVVEPELPEKPESPEPGENEGGEGEENDKLPDGEQVTDFVTGFIDGIFGIVNMFKSEGKLTDEEIDDIFQNIDNLLGTDDKKEEDTQEQ